MSTKIPAEVKSFLDYKVVERGIAELTQQNYRAVLCEFFSFIGRGPIQANEVDIKRYRSSLFDRKLIPRTITHHLAILREFFKFLQRDRLIKRDPMVRIESPKMWKRLPRYMAEIDIQQLVDAPGTNRLREPLSLRDRAICETFYASGIRVSELISAKLMDLDLNSGLITVFGKGSKERIAPLGRRAVDALRAYLTVARPLLQQRNARISPYLFIGYRTLELTRQAVCYMLRARAKRAGIAHVYPHLLRHSVATHMLDNGANLRVIQEILGHVDISTTEIYTHVSAAHVSSVFRNCHPRNNPKRAQIGLFQTPAPPLAPGPAMCTQCRNPVCERSKNLCELHLRLNGAASNDSHKRAHAQKKLDAICVNCDEPAVKGRVQCERHLRLNREATLRISSAKRRAQKKFAA